jgi:hypothetical protein
MTEHIPDDHRVSAFAFLGKLDTVFESSWSNAVDETATKLLIGELLEAGASS